MRAEIPPEVAALLEQLDRRIEESKALRLELQTKTAERRSVEQADHKAGGPDTSKTSSSKS
jgi:hypothetical protein